MSAARPEMGREASPEDMKFKAPEAKNNLDDEIQKKNVERVESLNKQLASVEREQQEIAANKLMSEKQKAEMTQRNEKTVAFLQKKLDKIPELPASEFDEIEEANPEDVDVEMSDAEILAEQAAKSPKQETPSALDAQHEMEKLRQKRAGLEQQIAGMEDTDKVVLTGAREIAADEIRATEAKMRQIVAEQGDVEMAAKITAAETAKGVDWGEKKLTKDEEMAAKIATAEAAKGVNWDKRPPSARERDSALSEMVDRADAKRGVAWENARATAETGAEAVKANIDDLKRRAGGLRELLEKNRKALAGERLTEDEEKVIGSDLQGIDRRIARETKISEMEKSIQALEKKLGVKREDIDVNKVSGIARFGQGLRRLFNRDYAELSKVSQAKLDLEAEIASENLEEKEDKAGASPASARGKMTRIIQSGARRGR